LGFTSGAYTWAEPRAGVIAFLVGDFLTDLILMKSEDNGETWEKTIIWEHPYPFMEMFTINGEPYYSNDGSISLAIDGFGDAHLAFGITRIFPYNQTDSLWFDPEVGAIAYWHEGMDTFSSHPLALYPGDHPNSELIENYNLIAWLQDIDGNGMITLEDSIVSYPTPGMVNMPQLTIDESEQVGLFFSAITEGYSNNIVNYRHIWHRYSPDNGTTWSNFNDITQSLIHVFDECIYPVATPLSLDYWLLAFGTDNTPGTAYAGQHDFQENKITFGEYEKEIIPMPWINTEFSCIQDTIGEYDTVFFINQCIGWPFPDNFYWEFEGGVPTTSEDFDPYIIYPTAGNYDVTLTSSSVSLQSTNIKEDFITVIELINLEESKKIKRLKISPNPVYSILKLSLANSKRAMIKIINSSGKIVFKNDYTNKSNNIGIDLSKQSSGLYFIICETENSILTEKFVLHH
jgi:hypothetical protein